MRLNVLFFGLSIASSALAQDKVCSKGPGEPLGIRGYTCASCRLERVDDGPLTYVFGTEPVITEGLPNSSFKAGDIITSMNGKPITTREAAQDFAYPKPGRNTVTVRRWQDNSMWTVTAQVVTTDDCRFASSPQWEFRRDPITALSRSEDIRKSQPDPTSQIGFAVTCTPACTKMTDKQGRTFWKHDGYPAIVAVRTASPAADAGLLIGDLIAVVNGISVTDEAGSRLLQSYGNTPLTAAECIKCEIPYLKMVIIRNGERREVFMQLVARR